MKLEILARPNIEFHKTWIYEYLVDDNFPNFVGTYLNQIYIS